MEPGMFAELAGVIAVFFGGAILLTPIVALSVRFALKPTMESLAKIKQTSHPETSTLQDRRISLLEAELENLRNSVQYLAEAEDFRRQLAVPAPADAAAARSGDAVGIS